MNQTWGHDTGDVCLDGLATKLSSLQSAFRAWDKTVFGSVRNKLKPVRENLVEERGGTLYRGPTDRERSLMRELAETLAREEGMERQRSRIDWLKSGDKNTEFFQAKAKARGRTNRIRALRTADGSLATDQGVMEQMASDFFRDLFTAQEHFQPDLICQYIPCKVSAQMGETLERPYTEEEIKVAIFQMKPGKAPGEDGFTAEFFQKHWELVQNNVTQAVLSFLNGGDMPEVINRTILVLIPKVANPQELTQFRPISLCNVLYKICSKAIANRLRLVLDAVVSLEQSAFVPGRLITDNVLVAYECIHYLRNKKGKTGACAIKLDMAKAYDRMEWRFLHDVMGALGFPDGWRNVVMRCVTLVTFSVRVNGNFSPCFKPSRGIRQGDPISPYLFLLCAEGLTSMLKARGPQFISRGVRVSCHAPWISHLLFADDCLIFTQASKRGTDRIAEILDTHNRGSGQLVNKQKSAVFFSANCEDAAKDEVRQALQIPTEALGERYLGLPTAIGKVNDGAFNYVSDRIRNFVNGWGEKTLSCAGREVLLKANAQAVPTYPMSCFKLPANICKKMRTYISNYWWGSSINNHKIHWQRWSKLTRSKADGGMGFRDLPLFNQALLGKQGWRLLMRPESLCARVLKGKYCPHGDFLSATRKKRSSEILKVRPGIRMQEDVIAWADERSGWYSIRSCCRRLKADQDQQEMMTENAAESSGNSRWWTAIWRLKIPPKVRIFWWRALNNFLPTKGELKRRHIEREDHFETCGEPGESLYHVALTCSFACQFWRTAQEITGCKLPALHSETWTRDILSGELCSPNEAALIICGAWSLWSGRNARKHGKTRWNPTAAVQHVASMVEDLVVLQTENAVSLAKQSRRVSWERPPHGWCKVNTDAAFHASSATGASGVVIRDADGKLIAASANGRVFGRTRRTQFGGTTKVG